MNIIKTVKTNAKKIVVASVAAVTGVAVNASAALDLSTLKPDVSGFEAIALMLITAGVAFWAIRKGMALLGR